MTLDDDALQMRRLALLGLALVLPALLLVVTGLGYSLFGWAAAEAFAATRFSHPVAVLGGLLLALGLNAAAVLHLDVAAEEDEFIAGVAVQRRPANLAVIVLALGLGAMIAAYVFTENFAVVAR